MKLKSQKDFVTGLLFVALGASFAIGALNYPFGGSAKPGPGYLPLGLGVLLALIGALLLFKALTIEVEGDDPIAAFAWRPLLAITGAVVLFGLLLPHAGLLLALPVLVVVASAGGRTFRWREVLVNALVVTAAAWLLFVVALRLPLPLVPGG